MLTSKDLKKMKLKDRWKYYNYKASVQVKKIKIDKEKLLINFFIGLAFFLIINGLIIFLIFFIKVSKYYTISSDIIQVDTLGQIGDFIGGIVGVIWSLAGILLFFATLRLQSRELKENRIHFELNRITDIIYKQLDMFNKQLEQFTLKDLEREKGNHKVYKGRYAIVILTRRLEAIIENNQNSLKGDNKDNMINFIIENFSFIEINKEEFVIIYEEISNHIDTIRTILLKDYIPPADLNELKGIFFRNVGREFLNSSELLLPLIKSYIDYKKKVKPGFDDIFSVEGSIKSKIEDIINFRNKFYDNATLKREIALREIYNLHNS